jgi:hypothetical protein
MPRSPAVSGVVFTAVQRFDPSSVEAWAKYIEWSRSRDALDALLGHGATSAARRHRRPTITANVLALQ